MEIRRVTDNLQKRNVTRFIQFSLIGSGYRKREKNMLRRVTIKFSFALLRAINLWGFCI